MAENKDWVLILNPIAGNGFVKKYEDTIKEKLKEFGVDADLIYTQQKGHASQIAEEYAKKGYKHIFKYWDSQIELRMNTGRYFLNKTPLTWMSALAMGIIF
ncbi:MAG: diacylglycerol kinase family protein [Calditrichaceae bacterium]